MGCTGRRAGLAYLARYDLVIGFASNKANFALALACLVALAAMFLSALDAATRYAAAMGAEGVSGGFGPLDVFAYFFAGSDYYRMDDKLPFELPTGWLIQQVLVAVLVGNYTVRDLGGQAIQVLTKVKGRWTWWLSKCLWTAATVFAFYVLEAVVAIVLAAAFGGFGAMGEAESLSVLGFRLSAIGGGRLVLMLLLPLSLSLALSLAQVALSLAAGPFAAFAAVMSFVTMSVYFGSPFLIGACSMMVRSAFVRQGGVDAIFSLAACVAVCAASVAVGGLLFRRKDIVGRQD